MTDKKITQLSAISTIVDADVFPVVENATITTKKTTWALIKSVLKTYFDALYTNGTITASTKTKITYDAKGLVTAGTDATTADIADSTDRRYCTDAQKTVIGNTSGTNSGNETATSIGTLVSGCTDETTVADADHLGFSDTSATNILKKITWANCKSTLKTYFDTKYPAETLTTISGLIAGASSTSIADGDDLSFVDISASNILRRISWSTAKATLKTVFDSIYSKTFTNSGTPGSGFASDTYITSSSIVIPSAGLWTAGCFYRVVFDMTKTSDAGTGAFEITLRMGTAGSTSDASIVSVAFDAGTAVKDIGKFEVYVNFRSVGSGTSAKVRMDAFCSHQLASTGLISTGEAGWGAKQATSSGFDSTTSTTIGISVNGGASFPGSSSLVQAELFGVQV